MGWRAVRTRLCGSWAPGGIAATSLPVSTLMIAGL